METRYSPPFQTGSGPPPLLRSGYRVSFPGVKRPERGVNHPPPYSAEVKERVELHFYTPSGPSWPVLGLPLHFACITYSHSPHSFWRWRRHVPLKRKNLPTLVHVIRTKNTTKLTRFQCLFFVDLTWTRIGTTVLELVLQFSNWYYSSRIGTIVLELVL